MRAEQSAVLASALALALGGEPDPAYFAALGRTPEEAREMAYRAKADRRWASALARHGFTP